MSREQRKIAVSSTFNILSTYSFLFLGIINVFFIARLISPYEWGILLFSFTFIGVVSYFCYFFPPAAESTIQYYIPKLRNGALTNNNKIRRFIFSVYKTRLIFTIIVYIIFIIIIHLIHFEEGKFLQILLIISPTIIIIVIQNINSSILLAFQKFKKIFFVNFINIVVYTLGNMFLFFLRLEYALIYIARLYLLGAVFSFCVSLVFVIPLIPHKTSESTRDTTLEELNYIQIHTKYGLFIVLSGVLTNISGLILNFLFYYLGVIVFITYLMICSSFAGFAKNISGSSRSSFISIFSELNNKENQSKYISTFYQLNKYLLLFLSIIVAILLFFSEIYINLIYSETYLIILLAIQIYLFGTFASIITRNLLIITHSTNRTIINFKLAIFQSILSLILTTVALLFFEFLVLIIFNLIIQFSYTVFLIYLINRSSEFNLKYITIFKPFLIFLISLIISLPFILFINFQIVSDIYLLNLLINSILRFLVFCIFFYLIIFFTKYISKEEVDLLIKIIPIFNSKKKLKLKIIKFVEKLFPSEKTKS
jgi:O-antigen/teichoic acid export membrane protein